MIPILLTRPCGQSQATAARLRAQRPAAQIEMAPLIRIAHCVLPEVAAGEALILTSANAVAAWVAGGGAGARDAWVVGPRTAGAARAAGLRVRHVAPDAAALIDAVPEGVGPLVHLHGAHLRVDVAVALARRGFAARGVVVYDQEACPLTPAARAILAAGPVLCPLYSPRTARLLVAACPAGALGNLRAVCLSPSVAEALPVEVVAVAESPDGATLERAVIGALDRIGG